jgi:anti-sigma regulatory factor (Ser/Thr protein kinase)
VTTRLLTVQIARDEDVVTARQRARQIAGALAFDAQDQTRIATAVSEMARNVARYAGRGTVEFALDLEEPALAVTVSDNGPGIPHLASVLEGSYRSETGMGVGIVGARRIMDAFEIETARQAGTVVRMRKNTPRRRAAIGRQDVARITETLAQQAPASLVQ